MGVSNPDPVNLNFKSIDVRSDGYVHVVITHDPSTNTAKCYLNGELAEEITYTENEYYGDYEFVPTTTTGVGGDYRTGNTCAFLGSIKSLAFYTDVRTDAEVKEDYEAVINAEKDNSLLAPSDKADQTLLASYDLTQAGDAYLKDLSKNGYDLIHADDKGITYKGDTTVYELVKKFEKAPQTFEAEIYIPQETTLSRPGVIIGTYDDVDPYPNMNFELSGSGSKINLRLRYTYINASGGKGTSDFSVNIYDKLGSWIHVAAVHATDAVYFYVNGAEVSKQAYTTSKLYQYHDDILDYAFCLGGDYRNSNSQNFKYNIRSIRLYSDVRTPSEIIWDYRGSLDTDDENLLAAYKFNEGTVKDEIKDVSGNGYHVYNNREALELMGDGLQFESNESYSLTKKLAVMPKTFEAEIYLPVKYGGRAGVVFGNYGTGKSLAFEIYDNGRPRIFYSAIENGAMIDKSYVFDCDIRTGDWAHVSFVIDDVNLQTLIYIDGKLAGTMEYAQYNLDFLQTAFVLGGDTRSGNEQNFKGLIRNVALYSDVRTAVEISEDAKNGTNLSNDNLIAAYKLSPEDRYSNIQDLTSNNYDIIYQDYDEFWFTEKEPVTDYAYSFAAVGDTQIVCQKYPDQMTKIYDWILANQEAKNIQHVFGLGDITNGNASTEWALAQEVISKMDGKLSYSLIRGNHDSSDMLNRYFNYEAYTSQFEGFYSEENIDSYYKTMKIGSTDYLFLTLDYGASDAELAWASEVVEAHPCHRVIVTTHAYLFRDGTTLDSGDVCPPADSNDANSYPNKVYNHGQEIWEKFISQHKNIFLVMSGHDPCDNVVTTQSVGVHGNTVTQMLIDPQGMDASLGATGMVAMLYFSEDGTEMEVEFYSTVLEKYYKQTNQYKITVPSDGVAYHEYGELKTVAPTCSTTGLKAHYECSDCGKYYDENKQEVTRDSLVVDMLDHEYGVASYAWNSDYSQCSAERKCILCDTVDTQVVASTKVTVPATCAEKGSNTYTAEFNVDGLETQVYVEEIPTTGDHVYVIQKDNEYHWKQCGCGVVEENSKVKHIYDIVQKDDEYHWNECICGLYVSKEEHNWDSGSVATKPTCTTNGEKVYKCDCNAEKSEVILAGHSYGEWIEETIPTCIVNGLKAHYQCSECLKYFNAEKAEVLYESLVTTAPHIFYYVETLSAGCEELGLLGHYECKTCDALFDDLKVEITAEELAIPAKGHMYGLWIDEVAATCEVEGSLGHYECSRCAKFFDEDKVELTNIVIPTNDNHPFSSAWESNENSHWHGTLCSHEAQQGLADHTWDKGEVIVEPTCEQVGVKAYYCTVCGAGKTEEVAKVDHSFKTYISLNDATCTQNGTKAADCEYGCGERDVVEDLDSMLEHTYEVAYDKKEHWQECVCGHKVEVEAHAWDEGEVILEATEDAEGEMLYTCTCGQTKTEVIAKLPGAPDTIQEAVGCSGSLAYSIFGLLALSGAVLVVRRRKETE